MVYYDSTLRRQERQQQKGNKIQFLLCRMTIDDWDSRL